MAVVPNALFFRPRDDRPPRPAISEEESITQMWYSRLHTPECNYGEDMFPDYIENKPEYMTIKTVDYEHLLNCLANAIYQPSVKSGSDRSKEPQKTIDDAWNEGMKRINNKDKDMNLIEVIKQ